jgi:biotin transport system substrate-specific component
MTVSAAVPALIAKSENKNLANVLSILAGVALIALLAQVAIPLPWTPVPITGQTLGVSLVALSWGWKRSSITMALYLTLGSLGLPFFASIGSLGATSGYLVGMLFSAIAVGYLADLGWTNSFKKALAAAYLGSFIVLGTGLFVLSYFLPYEALLGAGLIPFLPGDLIKNLTAAGLSTKIRSEVG